MNSLTRLFVVSTVILTAPLAAHAQSGEAAVPEPVVTPGAATESVAVVTPTLATALPVGVMAGGLGLAVLVNNVSDDWRHTAWVLGLTYLFAPSAGWFAQRRYGPPLAWMSARLTAASVGFFALLVGELYQWVRIAPALRQVGLATAAGIALVGIVGDVATGASQARRTWTVTPTMTQAGGLGLGYEMQF